MRVSFIACLAAFSVPVRFLPAGEPELSARWTILHRPERGAPTPRPLPPAGVIKPLRDFQFTGPMPSHPHVLGNFAVDGTFGTVNGGIQLVQGRSAAMELVEQADQFELEGRIQMKDLGGWFLLIGWNNETGNGYAIHNTTMKESGSPWYITEMRGRKAVEGAHQKMNQFEWNKPQDVKVSMSGGKLTFQLGPSKVLNGETLPNYQPGQIIFGVYDAKYGPRPVRIESLRVRALPPAPPPAEEAPAGEAPPPATPTKEPADADPAANPDPN